MSRFEITISDYGYWVADTHKGRNRFVPASPSELSALNADLAIARAQAPIREAGRTPRVYYRDAEGRIGIPPEPDMIPKDCQRYECTSLAEEDALAREMSQEMQQKWKDNGEGTEMCEAMLADYTDRPVGAKQELVNALNNNPRGRKEKEVIRIMLSELDREEALNHRVNTDFYWRSREMGHQ